MSERRKGRQCKLSGKFYLSELNMCVILSEENMPLEANQYHFAYLTLLLVF